MLLFWRWLIVGVSAATSIAVEAIEAHALAFSLLEVSIHGLLIPASIWVLLTLLAQNMARRARSEDNLAQHQLLTQHLACHQDYAELTHFIARFFGSLLPIDYAALFIYDHRQVRLEFASAWNATNVTLFTLEHHFNSLHICETCRRPRLAQLHRVTEASYDAHVAEYCLPLAYQNLLVGVLRLRCRVDQDLSAEQMGFLSDTSSQIALALALSIAQRRQMTQARIEAQVDERRQIAYELHNSLAQEIGYLHLSLDRLTTNGPTETQTLQQELTRMREVADDAYGRIRNNLLILRSWQQADLTQAIANCVRKFAQRTAMRIDFHTEGNPVRVPSPGCQYILSFARESLSNIETHAQARRASVQLRWLDDHLRIEVGDDGVGFDPEAITEGHYGLVMMHERVRRLGGELSIESARSKGTQLTFMIPLSR